MRFSDTLLHQIQVKLPKKKKKIHTYRMDFFPLSNSLAPFSFTNHSPLSLSLKVSLSYSHSLFSHRSLSSLLSLTVLFSRPPFSHGLSAFLSQSHSCTLALLLSLSTSCGYAISRRSITIIFKK